jgi:hypothetical protein
VVLHRQFPAFARGLPECDVDVVRAGAGEFQYGSSFYLLVQLQLRNASPLALEEVRLDVRGYDLAGREVSREQGSAAARIDPGRKGGSEWTSRLAGKGQVVRASVSVTGLRAVGGALCPAQGAPPPPLLPPPPALDPSDPLPPPASLDDPLIRTGQHRLNGRGFDCGEPDGVLNPQTRACVRAFQRSQGLAETGALDAATWERLNAATPAP